VTNVGFEGLVAPNDFATVQDGYANLDWGNVGVLGKELVHQVDPHSGYRNVIDKKAVAYLYGPDGLTGDATISATSGTFTLKSGIFASAFDTGDQVTFTAFKHHTTFEMHVVLDETPMPIVFDSHFHHVNKVEITWIPGTTVDPPHGSGPYLAVDDLKIAFHEAALPPTPPTEWMPDFAPVDAPDWPLA
jgi:hypothetical protein